VACRAARPKRDLIRVVRTPDGRVAMDGTGRAAGRGAYLCADGGCRTDPKTKGVLERALKTTLPLGLVDELGRPTDTMTSEGGARGQE
jgi:uncharacterized protein